MPWKSFRESWKQLQYEYESFPHPRRERKWTNLSGQIIRIIYVGSGYNIRSKRHKLLWISASQSRVEHSPKDCLQAPEETKHPRTATRFS